MRLALDHWIPPSVCLCYHLGSKVNWLRFNFLPPPEAGLGLESSLLESIREPGGRTQASPLSQQWPHQVPRASCLNPFWILTLGL